MELRQIGASGLQSTPVVFGAWAIGGWLWGGTDDEKAVEGINAALDAGVNAIDTAAVYGFGHSERIVGQAIAGRRDQVLVFTKCGLRWDGTPGSHHFDSQTNDGEPVTITRNLTRDSILFECEQSLQRLGVDCIDLYQCHWPDPNTPARETMGALAELLDQGLIRAIGVSNFTPDMIAECLEHGPVHCSQPKFSLLDRQHLHGVIAWCAARDIGTVVYSPMEQGILTGKVTLDRQFAEGDARTGKPWFQPQNLPRALEVINDVMRPIADRHNCTLAQLTLAWTIAAPGITCALAGARDADQARENAGAMAVRLSGDEHAEILAAFEALGEPH